MSESIFFAPIRTPFVNTRTGVINRDWYLFLLAMFERSGGSIAPTAQDILQSISQGLDGAAVMAAQAPINDALSVSPPSIPPIAFDDLLTEMRQTRELVAQLMTAVQAMQQGVPVL
jgi:hypothetical protein